MRRILGVVFVFVAVFALLAWHDHAQDRVSNDPPLKFRKVSEHSQTDVERCILKGNGSSVFSDFEDISVSGYLGRAGFMNQLLTDSRGSRLFIGLNGISTEVSLHSHHDPSEQQLDMLQWCSNRPTEVWLPKHLRKE